MAFSTYGELKTLLLTWSRITNIAIVVDDVIDLCEAEIFGNQREGLEVRELETRATAVTSTTSRFVGLPVRFLSMRRLNITTSSFREVEQRSPSSLVIRTGSERPKYFSAASQIEFDIQPDSAYDLEMLYFKRTTALDDTNTTNTVLTNYPNIYLQGCMWWAYDFAAEEIKAAERKEAFLAAIVGANKKDRKGRHGPAPVMATDRSTP